MCPQVMDDLHIDCTSQSLLNPALCSRALCLPTPMKKPLYLPSEHHHFFPSQSYPLCLPLCLVPSKVFPIFCKAAWAELLGLDRSAWRERERHCGLLWGTVTCRTETGLTLMLMVFRCCGGVGSLYQSFVGEQRLSGVQESLGEVV